MSNYIHNIIQFFTIEDAKKARRIMGIGFDFNKIIEMPKTMGLTSGSMSENADVWYGYREGKEVGADSVASIEKRFGVGEDLSFDDLCGGAIPQTLNDLYLMGKIRAENMAKYGVGDWYDWCWANWGTKWNAMDVDWHDDRVEFDTAWSGVGELLYRFAQDNQLGFTYQYADEDFGNNCGAYDFVCEDGVCMMLQQTIDDPDMFACAVWDVDYEG